MVWLSDGTICLTMEEKNNRYLYKVRLTNLLQRSCDDKIKVFFNESDAESCLKKWMNQSPWNSGFITKHQDLHKNA